MQSITAVVNRINPLGHIWIPNRLVKINDSVKEPASSNPVIGTLPCRLMVSSKIRVTKERRDCGSKYRQTNSMNSGYDLLEGLNETVSRIRNVSANVVNTLKDHEIGNTGMRKNVSLNTSNGIWAISISENTVATSCLFYYCNGGR